MFLQTCVLLLLHVMHDVNKNLLFKQLTVSAIRQESKHFITIEFAEEESARLHYQSGQYLTLVKQFRNAEERRSYSITSSPFLNEPLSIGVKRIDNGTFSRYLTDVIRPGDTITTTGAAGLFILPENITHYQVIYLFAAGSGITPIFSLLKTILHVYSFLKVVLIYSNHSPESTAFLQPLKQLQHQYKDKLTVHFLFSTDKNIYQAHLHRDLLYTFIKPDKHIANETKLAFICGPKNYRRMCMYTLQEAGFTDENIRKETFDTSEPVIYNLPPDTTSHYAHIHYAGDVHHIEVHYSDSILKAAKKNGISLPYSCEAGKCGNCAMRCKSGTVWMSYNEVLTLKDIENRLVLTCTGHPVFGDVELHG